MSQKVDEILNSGCLEKLLEEGSPIIKTEKEMLSYLEENGFNDVTEDDLKIIKEEISTMIELDQALDEAGAGTKEVKKCGVNYCDLRVKTSISPLKNCDAFNELAEIAFFVKKLKE